MKERSKDTEERNDVSVTPLPGSVTAKPAVPEPSASFDVMPAPARIGIKPPGSS